MNDPRPATQDMLNNVSISFVCNPLTASFKPARATSELGAVGDSLSETAAASPTTLVSLIAALSAGYDMEWPEASASDTALRAEIQNQCGKIVAEAFATSVDPDWTELDGINSKAWTEGEAGGSAPAASVSAIFEIINIIRDLAIKGLTIVDQKTREKAIDKFFSDEKVIEQLHAAIRSIDQAARVSQVAARLDAKEGMRASWAEFVATRKMGAAPARLGDSMQLLKAARDLASASIELDVTIRSRAADVVAKRTYAEVNQCRTTDPKAPCPRTALGKALYDAVERLRASATSDWSKMNSKDRTAYLESAFGVLNALASLSNDLAGFENDKENFRKLSDVMDDLPW